MGMGKTITTIAALDTLKVNNFITVCPSIARLNWYEELQKFKCKVPIQSVRVVLSSSEMNSILPGESVITSYQLAQKLPDYLTFDVGVLDEGHYLKNRMAQRTEILLFSQMQRAGAKARSNPQRSLLEKCNRVWSLTGTPSPNHLSELYTITKAFKVHHMNKRIFEEYFFELKNGAYGGRELLQLKPDKAEEFQRMLDSFMLRKTKSDPDVKLSLPPLVPSTIYVNPDKNVLSKLDSEEFVDFKEKEDKAKGTDIDSIIKEAMSMSSLRKAYGLQKVKGTIEYIKENLENENMKKIIVFCHHRMVNALITEELKDFGAVQLLGGMGVKALKRSEDTFQKDPNCKVIVASISASNTAINLYEADTVVFLEMDWVPGNNDQAVGRAQRFGQQNDSINVVFVCLEGNELDKNIIQGLRRKSKDVGEFIRRDDVSDLKYEEIEITG